MAVRDLGGSSTVDIPGSCVVKFARRGDAALDMVGEEAMVGEERLERFRSCMERRRFKDGFRIPLRLPFSGVAM